MTEKVAGRAGAGLIVFICFLIAALEGYDIQAFGVAAPKFGPALGLDPGQIGNAGGAAMFGLVIGAVVGGWLADRVGRKPVLLVSTAAFGIFSIATALAPDYPMLLLARFVTGLGFGGAMPNLIAIATEISSPKRRAATVTAMFCGMPAGGASVALLARIMGEGLDWRTIFHIGGILPLLLVPVILRFLPETRPDHARTLDRSLAKALFGEGRALPTLGLWLVFMLTLVVLYLLLNWLPLLVIGKGLTPADGASAALVFNLTGIAGALIVGFLVDRAGFRWPLLLTCLALAAAMWGLGGAHEATLVIVLSGIAGFFLLGAQYSLYALSPTLYPPQVRAASAGMAVAVGRVGSIIGPLIAGQLRTAGYSADQVLAATIPVVLAAAVGVVVTTTVGKPYSEAEPSA